jgi:hypothetical protein
MNLARGITAQFVPERLEKRLSCRLQLSLQAFCAIAVAASPGFGTILIAAAPPVVRILDPGQFEISLPIGSLFLQRSRTVTDLDPTRRVVRTKPGVFHVPQIFTFGHRPLAQSPIVDCLEKRPLTALLYSCSN